MQVTTVPNFPPPAPTPCCISLLLDKVASVVKRFIEFLKSFCVTPPPEDLGPKITLLSWEDTVSSAIKAALPSSDTTLIIASTLDYLRRNPQTPIQIEFLEEGTQVKIASHFYYVGDTLPSGIGGFLYQPQASKAAVNQELHNLLHERISNPDTLRNKIDVCYSALLRFSGRCYVVLKPIKNRFCFCIDFFSTTRPQVCIPGFSLQANSTSHSYSLYTPIF